MGDVMKLTAERMEVMCQPLAAGFDATADAAAIGAAIRRTEPLALRQAWRAEELEGASARAGRVWTGRHAASLIVYAELEDEDIFHPAAAPHETLDGPGDLFEMLLRPVGQKAYYELHVTPGNLRAQFRFPDAQYIHDYRRRKAAGQPATLIRMTEPLFHSRTWVRPEQRRWDVLAVVPLASIAEADPHDGGGGLLFSFCRYDYTRASGAMEIYSTSPHPEPNFHRQRDWGLLTWAE